MEIWALFRCSESRDNKHEWEATSSALWPIRTSVEDPAHLSTQASQRVIGTDACFATVMVKNIHSPRESTALHEEGPRFEPYQLQVDLEKLPVWKPGMQLPASIGDEWSESGKDNFIRWRQFLPHMQYPQVLKMTLDTKWFSSCSSQQIYYKAIWSCSWIDSAKGLAGDGVKA